MAPPSERPVEELYAEDEKLKKEDVAILQEWLSKQPHLPKLTDRYVAKFLHSCIYRIELAKDVIDRYFTLLTNAPNVFSFLPEGEMKAASAVTFVNVLPKTTPDKYFVLMMKLTDFKSDNFNFLQQLRYIMMVVNHKIHTEGLVWGAMALFDMKGFTLSHLAKFDLSGLKRILEFVQGAAPVRIKGVHFINIVPFSDKIVAIAKPFLTAEIYNMLQFHKNIEDLYKYIPKENLPEDYGGSLQSCQKLTEQNVKVFADNMDYFKWHDTLKVDESKRLDKSKADAGFGVEGTFKKLQLD